VSYPKPTLVLPGEGKSFDVLGVQFSYKAVAQDTRGEYALLEGFAPPGSGTPIHIHHREDEGFYILEGTFEVLYGEERFVVTPGSFALLPRNVPHGFRTVGDRPGKLLGIISPAGLEAFFEHMSVLAAGGPPDPERVQALAAKFGVELVRPA
jgi:mannose-6-phosphate isomerase-like protein (cupin superfamily)